MPSSNLANQFSVRDYYFSYKKGEFRDNVLLRVDETLSQGLTLVAELTFATAYRDRQHYYGTGDSYVEALSTHRGKVIM